MATIEQEKQQFARLKDLLEKLNAIKPESLTRTEMLGKELSFESGLPVFHRTLGLFRDLSEVDLTNLPFETLSNLADQANDCLILFTQIQSFSLQQNPTNPAQARDSLIVQLRDKWNQYYTFLAPHISYAMGRKTD